MKYYSIITRNEILMHVKLGDIILNERRQSQKDYIIHNSTYLKSPEIATSEGKQTNKKRDKYIKRSENKMFIGCFILSWRQKAMWTCRAVDMPIKDLSGYQSFTLLAQPVSLHKVEAKAKTDLQTGIMVNDCPNTHRASWQRLGNLRKQTLFKDISHQLLSNYYANQTEI